MASSALRTRVLESARAADRRSLTVEAIRARLDAPPDTAVRDACVSLVIADDTDRRFRARGDG